MIPAQVAQLLVLAAIWGGSFLFMRVAAPAAGPVLTAELRVLIAGLVLWAWLRLSGVELHWCRHGSQYLAIGALNSGLPFLLFSFAALHIPASYSALLNATAPLFGAGFAALWLGERIGLRSGAGLLLGVAGVGLVASPGGGLSGPLALWSVAACLLAACCYGLAGAYMQRRARGLDARAVAAASQLTAAVLLAPMLPLNPWPVTISLVVGLNLLALAVFSSALAYLMYYRLLTEVGATRALTVTFLIPAFGMAWGALFLDEAITATMLTGAGLILAGTFLVLRGR
jgi:drug/metabolite transporter (DMT)-like permease